MARPLRVEYPGALYHVMSRGNARQNIYSNDNDRKEFLKNLEHCIKMHNLICHAYCLMSNHYHLLLETPDGNLSQAMRDVNGNYTQKYNYLHDSVGHLLQGRYKAFVIERETYFLEVARYIVLNPVRDNLIKHPKLWKWSNYNATAGHIKVPAWLDVNTTQELFSRNNKEAQKKFRKFVKDGINAESPYDNIMEGNILGSQQFVDFIWEKTFGSEVKKEYPREERIVGRPTLDSIFKNIKNKDERNKAIIFAKRRCGYLNSEIAAQINLDRSTIGKISKAN